MKTRVNINTKIKSYYVNPLKKKQFLYQCNQKLKLNRLQTLLTQI